MSTTNPTTQKAILFDKRLIHIAQSLILVPYLPRHVPKYHGWMSNAQILQQTASEPLSLEEEFNMQLTWATDEDKRTCILVPRVELHQLLLQLPLTNDTNPIPYLDQDDLITHNLLLDRRPEEKLGTCNFCHKENQIGDIIGKDDNIRFCCLLCEANAACGDFGVEVAIGDVNLFLHDYLQDENDNDDGGEDRVVGVDDDAPENQQPTVAEVEIMIAEVSARRKGFGEVAVKLLTQYAVEWLQIKRFIAKINDDNLPSQALFQQRLQYQIYAKVECFEEIHLDWHVDTSNDFPWYPTRNKPINYTPYFWKQ